MRRSSRTPLHLVVFVALIAVRHSAFGAVAITAFAPAPFPSDGGGTLLAFSTDSTIGWSFTPRQDIYVTDLGFYDGGIGLSSFHSVGIWDVDGRLLTSVVVGGNAGSGDVFLPGEVPQWPRLHEGEYSYATIERLRLRAGETYVIGATVPLGSPVAPCVEGWVSRSDGYPVSVADGSLAVDSLLSVMEPALLHSGTAGPEFTVGPGELSLPREVVPNGTFVGVNFQFAPVPEPSTSALAVAAVVALGLLWRIQRRR